ncbi:hypothetical protein [Stenotrophomonas sp. PS02300]|uniref:hypothetical protein n=1 Tax=Stenotrophomonas sp. PS02300 TaxID=2991426 RepID=UPI00249CA5DB|nr:hypothetical protein [Stenotrophomonas sp. PS02300]
MPVTGEQIFVKCLKTALLIGSGYILFELGNLMATMDCTSNRPTGALMWPWLLSLPILFVYHIFDFLKKGLFKVNVIWVRIAAALLLTTELVIAAHFGTQLSTCPNEDGSVMALPAMLLLFYTAFALSLLFGDAWLGVIRTLARRGRRAFDLSPADDVDPFEAIQTSPRRKKRKPR